jgi:FkbM family methyltransferase
LTRTADLKFMNHPPLLFALAKAMIRRRIRGGERLISVLGRLGYFDNRIVRYRLKPNYYVFVPIYRPERWDRIDLLEYERGLIAEIARAASEFQGPVTVVDCGADIGLISALVAAEIDEVSRIIAFEPSDEASPVLRRTLAELPFETKAIQAGVCDFAGRGELKLPSYSKSHHARYLVQVPQGGFPVTTIDATVSDAANVLIKIDVEGGEINVIRGGKRVLSEAKKAIVSVEAHPLVFQRTGIDPILILRELAAIRPFRFVVAETGRSKLDLNRPFFEQEAHDGTIYNIVCSSR